MKAERKALRALIKFAMSEIDLTVESVTWPVVKNYDFAETKRQNRDKPEMQGILAAEKAYEAIQVLKKANFFKLQHSKE